MRRDARYPRDGAAARAMPSRAFGIPADCCGDNCRDNCGLLLALPGMPGTAALRSSRFLLGGDTGFAPRILIASSMGWCLLALSSFPPGNMGTVGVVLRKCTRNACQSPDFTDLWKRGGKFHLCYRRCPDLKVGEGKSLFHGS